MSTHVLALTLTLARSLALGPSELALNMLFRCFVYKCQEGSEATDPAVPNSSERKGPDTVTRD